jgi:hypothetical protein
MNHGQAQNKNKKMTRAGKNIFSLGSQVGGPRAADATQVEEQHLRDALNQWSRHYTDAVREFAFLLRVDGEIDTYTKRWKIFGAQEPKKKKDWIEVEIGIPQDWWKEGRRAYRQHLAEEVERALSSMVKLLQKDGNCIIADNILADWQRIKTDYLR